MESEENRAKIKDWLLKELGKDWEDDDKMRPKFKGFSGQRSDWEPNYIFWRDLIINLSRHLRVLFITPSQVKSVWFNRGGLTPLCLDHVLLEMQSSGELLRSSELIDPASGRLSQIFRRVVRLAGLSRSSDLTEDDLIVATLLKEKAAEVVKVLSDNHWTYSCIITIRKLQEICGGSREAYAVLSYLSGSGKAKYLSINRQGVKEGVKISLSTSAVSSPSTLDYDTLHLIWTAEKLQQQLDGIDQRCEILREKALTSLKSGNKVVALRHTRELKLASQSREKCTTLLNRVDEVIRALADAESSKQVTEAIQIGARAIKENSTSVEEVQRCLEELDESIATQKEVDNVLGSVGSTTYTEIEDEDIEDEFKTLELEFGGALSPVLEVDTGSAKETISSETADLLSESIANLRIKDDNEGKRAVVQDSAKAVRNNRTPEAA
nr:PREDICTED: charged multivesicular body protein 7 isoform X2 [Daucus carota subsp. sativus]